MLVPTCWQKHDLHDICFGKPRHGISWLSPLQTRYIIDPIAEIASLGCTVLQRESDKVESTSQLGHTESDVRERNTIATENTKKSWKAGMAQW